MYTKHSVPEILGTTITQYNELMVKVLLVYVLNNIIHYSINRNKLWFGIRALPAVAAPHSLH